MIGNIPWLVLAGLWMALAYLIAGVIQCFTIIGSASESSVQARRLRLVAVRTRRPPRADRDEALSCLGNAVWFVLSGRWLALGHLLTGLLLCLTIIGIPFGVASFKLAGLALVPFGKVVVKAGAPLPAKCHHLPHRVTATKGAKPLTTSGAHLTTVPNARPWLLATRTYRHCGTARLASGRSTIRSVREPRRCGRCE